MPFASTAALRGLALSGAASACVYIVTGTATRLIVAGFVLVVLYEPCTLQWPWHYLTAEMHWLLTIAAVGGYTALHPISFERLRRCSYLFSIFSS